MTTDSGTVIVDTSTRNVRPAPQAILLGALAGLTWFAILFLIVIRDASPDASSADEIAMNTWIGTLFPIAISVTLCFLVLGGVRHMLNQLARPLP